MAHSTVTGAWKTVSMSPIKAPSEFFIVADSAYPGYAQGPIQWSFMRKNTNWSCFAFPHKDRGNILFIDGHVEAQTVNELTGGRYWGAAWYCYSDTTGNVLRSANPDAKY